MKDEEKERSKRRSRGEMKSVVHGKSLWVYESCFDWERRGKGALRGTRKSKGRGSSNYPTAISYLFHLRAVYNEPSVTFIARCTIRHPRWIIRTLRGTILRIGERRVKSSRHQAAPPQRLFLCRGCIVSRFEISRNIKAQTNSFLRLFPDVSSSFVCDELFSRS